MRACECRSPSTISSGRAALVYGDRTAVVDEPGTAGSFGTITYRELSDRARGMARALHQMGVERGERVAIVSPNAARMLTAFYGVSGYGRVLVPINFRLNAEEVQYIVEHSGASVLLVDPEFDSALGAVTAKERIVLDGYADRELFAPLPDGSSSGAGSSDGWEPDEDATASINYTSGTTARPKGVQLTHRNCWLNAAVFGWQATVTDRDVYLHTLPMFHCNGWGMPYAVTGMGCPQIVLRKVDGAEILRRIADHGVTLLCGAPAVVAAVLDAATRRRTRGEEVAGPGAGAHRGGRSAPAVEGDRAGGDRARLGVHPDLRADRDGAAAHDQPGARGVGFARRPRNAPGGCHGPGCLRSGWRWTSPLMVRCWPGPTMCSPGTGNSPSETAAALEDGWFHTGDGGSIDEGGYLVDFGPEEGRHHHAAARMSRRSKSRTACTNTPTSPRWR